jgi:hypothetical protein
MHHPDHKSALGWKRLAKKKNYKNQKTYLYLFINGKCFLLGLLGAS